MAVEQYPAPGPNEQFYQQTKGTMAAVGDVVSSVLGQIASAIIQQQRQQASNVQAIPTSIQQYVAGNIGGARQSLQSVTSSLGQQVLGQQSTAASLAAIATQPTTSPVSLSLPGSLPGVSPPGGIGSPVATVSTPGGVLVPSAFSPISTWYAHPWCYYGLQQLPIFFTEQGIPLAPLDQQGPTEQSVINQILIENKNYGILGPYGNQGGHFVGPIGTPLSACSMQSQGPTGQPITQPTGTTQQPPSQPGIGVSPPSVIPATPFPVALPQPCPQPVINLACPQCNCQVLFAPIIDVFDDIQRELDNIINVQNNPQIVVDTVNNIRPLIKNAIQVIGKPPPEQKPPVVNCNCPACNVPITVETTPVVKVSVTTPEGVTTGQLISQQDFELYSNGTWRIKLDLSQYPDFANSVGNVVDKITTDWELAIPDEPSATPSSLPTQHPLDLFDLQTLVKPNGT